MHQATTRKRFSRRRTVSLEQATPELMEARPDTAIRLSAAQLAQLEQIERAAGWGHAPAGCQGIRPEPAPTI